jgi:acyl-CoA reductase-like NAD-dependent aldehyde dehydrogenase
MKIVNPATGAVIADVAIDNGAAVRASIKPLAQPSPPGPRCPSPGACRRSAAFGNGSSRWTETLARTLTSEVGKPIRQSRNEIKGLLARIDFFLEESTRALRDEKVHADVANNLEERISHEPLGVIANISAWNYPYFVGSNVFVPALVAGNAVLYKPSEYATLTGLHIAQMMREAGVPSDVFVAVVGDAATGAALLRQPVDGIFFTGSYGTGAKIAARRASG